MKNLTTYLKKYNEAKNMKTNCSTSKSKSKVKKCLLGLKEDVLKGKKQ